MAFAPNASECTSRPLIDGLPSKLQRVLQKENSAQHEPQRTEEMSSLLELQMESIMRRLKILLLVFSSRFFSSCEDYCRTATHWLHPAAMDIKTVGLLFGVVSVNKTTKDCLPLKIRHCAKWHFSKTFLRSSDSVVSCCCCWERIGLLSLQDTISLIRL